MKLVNTSDLGSDALMAWTFNSSVLNLFFIFLSLLMFIIEIILSFLTIAVPILVAIAYLTLAERKIMGSMQQRFGPNSVGFLGLLQPAADGLKLLLKESVIPSNSNTFSFILAPILTFFLSLIG